MLPLVNPVEFFPTKQQHTRHDAEGKIRQPTQQGGDAKIGEGTGEFCAGYPHRPEQYIAKPLRHIEAEGFQADVLVTGKGADNAWLFQTGGEKEAQPDHELTEPINQSTGFVLDKILEEALEEAGGDGQEIGDCRDK